MQCGIVRYISEKRRIVQRIIGGVKIDDIFVDSGIRALEEKALVLFNMKQNKNRGKRSCHDSA